jgi:hypothetical protein
MKTKITWTIEDGYVGKLRPQTFIFNSEDYMDDEDWEALTEQERLDAMHEAAQDDFDQKVSWAIIDYGNA